MQGGQLDTDVILEDLWHRAQLHDLVMRYSRAVDRKDTSSMLDVFYEDAYIENGPFKGNPSDFVAWVMENHVHVEQSMHIVGNCLVDRNGDVAIVESYCVGHQRRDKSDLATRPGYVSEDPEPTKVLRIVADLRWVDRAEFRDGGWRIAHRRVIMENAFTHSVTPFDPQTSDPPESNWIVQTRDPYTDALWTALSEAGIATPGGTQRSKESK